MTRYIGIDVHQHSCTAVVLGPTGRRTRTEVMETVAEKLRGFVVSLPRPRHLCFEEGTQSEWLHEVLEPIVDELVVVQPTKRDGNKSDAIDAHRLADGLRRGTLEQMVFKAGTGQFTALRQAVRGYDKLMQDVVRSKNRLKVLYVSRGIGADKAIYDPKLREPFLRQLPHHHRRLAQLLGAELDGLLEVRAMAEAWLHEEGEKLPIVQRLTTAPGIGPVRAAQIVSAVVTPWRFRTKRQFWSYCGLAVVTRSSADWIKQESRWVRQHAPRPRGLNRNRNPRLKGVFNGAAMSVISLLPEHPLHQAYRRSLEHTKPNLARLTLARRIAAAVLAMWKNQEDYDPTKHEQSTSRT